MMSKTIGQRVVSNAAIEIYPLGIWPIGTTGTVVSLDTLSGQAVAHVKLDTHFDCLNEWENCLMVWETGDEAFSDAVMSAFSDAQSTADEA